MLKDINNYARNEDTRLDRLRREIIEGTGVGTEGTDLDPNPYRNQASNSKETQSILQDMLDKYDSGQISEEELYNINQENGNLVSPEKLQKYVQSEFTNNIDTFYKRWLDDNPGGTREEFANDFQNNYQTESVYSQTAHYLKDNKAQTYVNNSVKKALNAIGNSDRVKVVTSDGKHIKLGDKITIEDIKNDGQVQGINFYNPDMGDMTYDMMVTKDNKVYNISVPIPKGDPERIGSEVFIDMAKKIQRFHRGDQRINLGPDRTGRMMSVPLQKEKGPGGEYFIEVRGMKITYSDLIDGRKEVFEQIVDQGSTN